MRILLFRALGLILSAGFLAAATTFAAAGDKKIRVVIIDGQNNHNWQATTPVLKKALEDSGRFTVEVSTSPPVPMLNKPGKPKDDKDEKAMAKYKEALAKYEAAKPKFDADLKAALPVFAAWTVDFDKFDVVVSNYNNTNPDAKRWPKAIDAQLEERLQAGKIGLVIVHAANNAFGGWKEYDQMIGMGWRGAGYGSRLKLDDAGTVIRVPPNKDGSSNHGYTGKFNIVIRDPDHPITKGMPLEWAHANDELYDNMRGPIENVHLLATAYSPRDPAKKLNGTGFHEPMIWTVSYGKGRVFHTPMGHDVNAMRCIGFQATLNRGTEWAATGKVTLALPTDFPTDKKISVVPAAK